MLATLNSPSVIDTWRVGLWTERCVEAQAALIRHELEHSRQFTPHGEQLLELATVAHEVLSGRAGGLRGGGHLYQLIPTEFDANAAAAMFVRRRYGDEAINKLLDAGHDDSAAFRSLTGPEDLDGLPGRMVRFLSLMPNLCDAYAAQGDFTFSQLLNLIWPGMGDQWQRLTTTGGA